MPTEPRKVEWVAVERPESSVCSDCGGAIECQVEHGDWMPRCYKCDTYYLLRFSEPIKAIAWEEAQAQRDAKKIAALESEVGNLQADLAFVKSESRSELKTLSETIDRQTREIGVANARRHRTDALCEHAITAMESAGKRLAELKAAPAPPADSREAFEEWAETLGYSLGLDGKSYCSPSTRMARHGWLAALASRKPGKIAEVKGCNVRFIGGDWWQVSCPSQADGMAEDADHAHQQETTDGKTRKPGKIAHARDAEYGSVVLIAGGTDEAIFDRMEDAENFARDVNHAHGYEENTDGD